LSTLKVFDLGAGIFGEPTNSIDAIVTIGRDDEATTAAKREAFTNKFERCGGVGGEYADVVLSGSIKVF
jgi:hypothetical protein